MFTFDETTHTYTLDGKVVPSVTEILAPLTVGKYADNGVIRQAALRGSRVHELCALYDMDGLPVEFEAEALPYVNAWTQFARDYNAKWLWIEHPMCAGGHFAGTMDRLGMIDGKYTVVDIKTAQSLDRPAKLALSCQLYAYQKLCKVNALYRYSDPEDCFGVQLLKSGDYRIYRREDIEKKYRFDSADLFAKCLDIYCLTRGK